MKELLLMGSVIFLSVLAALWVWTYGSLFYFKDMLNKFNKFKLRRNEKTEKE
jgi:hypothetical protein